VNVICCIFKETKFNIKPSAQLGGRTVVQPKIPPKPLLRIATRNMI